MLDVKQGDIVIYHNHDQSFKDGNNTYDEAPAIVNKVWSENCINITIIRDCNAPISATSVVRFNPEAEVQNMYWKLRE